MTFNRSINLGLFSDFPKLKSMTGPMLTMAANQKILKKSGFNNDTGNTSRNMTIIKGKVRKLNQCKNAKNLT
jgi:hypothetical protein